MQKRISTPGFSGAAPSASLLREAGKELRERELAAELQAVGVATLRDGAAVLGQARGQRVAVEHRDAVVGVRH